MYTDERVMVEDEPWNNGICSGVCGGDCGTCWAAWCCPCFLFGRLSSRMGAFPTEQKDVCNGDCAIFCFAGLFGLSCLPVCLKRSSFRRAHHLKGNGCGDCMTAWCCLPCSLAQMETEVKERADSALKMYAGYSSPKGGMSYASQRG